MEEVKATEIMEAYNKKYSPKVSLGEVKQFLMTHAFFNVSPEFAAMLMYKSSIGGTTR